ncbi:MAG: hypothetical protein NTW52_00855 [Planctomycetota bacterium]|nr:hypothetical protein [Planctomycetota bacterium]
MSTPALGSLLSILASIPDNRGRRQIQMPPTTNEHKVALELLKS